MLLLGLSTGERSIATHLTADSKSFSEQKAGRHTEVGTGSERARL